MREKSDMSKMVKQFEKEREERGEIILYDKIEFPVTINKVLVSQGLSMGFQEVGSMVSIRPVPKEYEEKTFLGIYLGDLKTNISVALFEKSKELVVRSGLNPAIFVPDLNKIIWGYESWWGVIASKEQLHQITDEDIQNVWYVKALKQLAQAEEPTDE